MIAHATQGLLAALPSLRDDPIRGSLEVRPGNYNFSTAALNNRGTNGYAWSLSSTAGGTGYNFNFNTNNVNPGTNNNNKGNGLQVRCVAL